MGGVCIADVFNVGDIPGPVTIPAVDGGGKELMGGLEDVDGGPGTCLEPESGNECDYDSDESVCDILGLYLTSPKVINSLLGKN
jgi:hypothetical protein